MAGTTQVVHLVLLGWEFDRAVLPFIKRDDAPPIYRPHRIHVIVAGRDDARGYDKRVEEALSTDYDLKLHYVDKMRDGHSVEFDEVAGKVAELCTMERKAGNFVSVNLSSGSKLGCLAAGTACMAFPLGDVQPYYVVPETYTETGSDREAHGIAKGLRDVVELGLPLLELPDFDALDALDLIAHEASDGWIKYGDLLVVLARESPRFRDLLPRGPQDAEKSARNLATTTLTRSIIRPLESLGLLETDKIGRDKRVRLTARGRLHTHLRKPA